MSDLNDLEASLPVKIAGADPSTGVENFWMTVDSAGNAAAVVNNGAGASAVNIQDGGNSITVDGAVTVSGTVTANQGTPAVIANSWPVTITNGSSVVTVKALSDTLVAADLGLVTNSVIYGETTAGGGGYVEVKVTPSGAVATAVGDISGVVGQQNMANSLPVVIASNQSAIPVTQSTSPWVVSGSVASVVSGSVAAVQSGTWTVDNKELPDSTTTYALLNSDSIAYESARLVKASPGKLFTLTGYNSSSAAQFIQVHNTTSLPADTAVPVVIFFVPKQSNFALDFSKWGKYFSTGITICNSSTGPTKTIDGNNCWFSVTYI